MDLPNHTADFSNESTIVIGIPGTWADADALRHALQRHDGGYSYAGMMLLHEATQTSCGVELVDHDPNLREAYEMASFGRLDETVLEKLAEHTFTVYLVGEGGSTEKAKTLLPAALALLEAGGLAVKVEASGKVFNQEDWATLCALDDATYLYDAFVLKLHAGGDVYHTCGMHSLGLRDAIVGAVEAEVAAHTLDVFSMYQILEQPNIQTGESFSPKEDWLTFQISDTPEKRFATDDARHNRYGLWVLHPEESIIGA